MTWSPRYSFGTYSGLRDSRRALFSMKSNDLCFIRKEHKCGKIFGASKSCFIACPIDERLEPILELISEKLTKVGIEPIIAVKERAYGQDIFCTKICGKIIEARFCIVILDDTITSDVNIPNPNVYYEYGLMTGLHKHIIPLQKSDLKLAFNIQSYDTIKYSSGNIGKELDRAIKDAIRVTEAEDDKPQIIDVPEMTILRRFELSGFILKDNKWFLSDQIEDTLFKGFGHIEERVYLYLGKIDDDDEFQTYLEDLDVLLFRTERKAKEMEDELVQLGKQNEELSRREEEESEEVHEKGALAEMDRPARRLYQYSPEREKQRIVSRIADLQSKLELMDSIYVGFIISDQLDSSEFKKNVQIITVHYERYTVTYNDGPNMRLGEMEVILERRIV